jgi:hypothetical protein
MSEKRNEQPLPRDGWNGIERKPAEDEGDSDADWLWSRSLPLDGINEIRDPAARAVIDGYTWQCRPWFDYGENALAVVAEMTPKPDLVGPQRGADHHAARIDHPTAVRIVERLVDGERVAHVARSEGLPDTLVRSIATGRTWRHLTTRVSGA